MPTLGERIRKLRKARKLTLEALAGDTLTKGMLSLIENNKANPSMESLNYIAKQLDIEVSELLEEMRSEEISYLTAKVEKFYYERASNQDEKYAKIIELIQPYADKLHTGYEAAKLLDFYGRALYIHKKEEWQFYLDKAVSLYEQLNIAPKHVDIAIFRSYTHSGIYDYENALKTLQTERSIIEEKYTFIDPLSRLDLDHAEATLLFSVGESEKAFQLTKDSIQFSNEQQILYQIDALYRLATFYAIMIGEEEQFHYYLKKSKLFGELVESQETILFYHFAQIHYFTTYQQNFEKALSLLDSYNYEEDTHSIHTHFYHLEKGKVLFGLLDYKKALDHLQKVDFPKYSNHPFDLSIHYSLDAYLALCYHALGDEQQASKHAQIAYENILLMPTTPYKDFIIETYKKIRSN